MSFLRQHNPEINWEKQEIKFTRCSKHCTPQTIMIQDEDLDGLEIPHLEEHANDQPFHLNGDEWEDFDQFIHWVNFSEDPDAITIREGLNDNKEDRPVSAAEKKELDKDYWSNLVPKHYQEFYD